MAPYIFAESIKAGSCAFEARKCYSERAYQVSCLESEKFCIAQISIELNNEFGLYQYILDPIMQIGKKWFQAQTMLNGHTLQWALALVVFYNACSPLLHS